MDIYQVPDKLLAAINMLIPSIVFSAVMMAPQAGQEDSGKYLLFLGAMFPRH